MEQCVHRVVDAELADRLGTSGAVLIEGPKVCGKTVTATTRAKSVVRFDTDANARNLFQLSHESLFEGPVPILFDEWQRVPDIWDHVRRHVDDAGSKGLYIMTGSATPKEARELHSGAGRISRLQMRPMSLYESGHSTAEISLSALLSGVEQTARLTPLTVAALMERIVVGGWPSLLGADEQSARRWLGDYLAQIVEVDVPTVAANRRAPERLRRTLASLARCWSTSQSLSHSH